MLLVRTKTSPGLDFCLPLGNGKAPFVRKRPCVKLVLEEAMIQKRTTEIDALNLLPVGGMRSDNLKSREISDGSAHSHRVKQSCNRRLQRCKSLACKPNCLTIGVPGSWSFMVGFWFRACSGK